MAATLKRHTPMMLVVLMLATAIWILTGIPPAAAANAKRGELNKIIADITLLQQQLKDRIDQSRTLHTAIGEQRTMLNAEIQVLVRSLRIKTLQQALQHLRLRHNLELLRVIHTYMDELDTKRVYYQTGRDRLSYLRQLAEDDIRMIAAVSDLKIDALTTQISLVINRYLPEAHTIQIDPQQVELISAEQVWQRTTAGLK